MPSRTRLSVKSVFLTSCLLILSALSAIAQLTDTGSIVGTVRDPSGAAVPGATVTATETGTNVRRTTTTNDGGDYVLPSLKIGTYSITIEKSGFQSFIHNQIPVDVQSRIKVDAELQVGSARQTVEVTAAAQLLNTQSAELGHVVGSKKVEDLPLNGRHYSSLALLVPGVFIPTGNLSEIGGEGYFGVNGNSATQNNYVIDGIDNNSYIENFQGKSAQAGQVPVDAVAEFKLQTRTYDTEFGHSAGGVVNAQIKSGTNQLHGDAWEFVRNSAFDATDFFTNLAGGKKPAYQQNQFGGTAGGPILKDRLFVFGAYEGFRERQGDTQIGTVPTPMMRSLDFSELPNPPTSAGLANLPGLSLPQLAGTGLTPSQCIQAAKLNPACVDPTAAKVITLYPMPNLNLSQNGVAGGFKGLNYIAAPKRTINTDTGVIRADQKLGEKDSLYEHYSIFDLSEYNPFIFQAYNPIADGSTDISLFDNRNQNGAVGWTHIFSPTTVLDFRAGANQLREDAKQLPFGQNVNDQYGINGIPVDPRVSGGLPEFDISGFSQLGSSRWTPMVQKSRVYQFRGILTAIRGSHNIKGGAEWRRDRQIYLDNCCDRGGITFNGQYTDVGQAQTGITDFLLGVPNYAGLTSITFANKYQNGLSLFAQDTWRVSKNLTVNYGLRWERVPYFISSDNAIANFNPNGTNSLGGSGVLYTASAGSSSQRSTVQTYNKAFAPRLGLAYQLQNKLVFRAGYAIFYENYDRLGNQSDLALNPPFFIDHEINFSSTLPPSILLQNGFPPGFVSPVDITNPDNVNQFFLRAVDPNLRPGMIQQMSGGFEYSLSPSTLLSASWVGNYSHRMWRALNLNQKVLTNPGQPSGDVPFPNYVVDPSAPLTQTLPTPLQYLESTGNANYNAALISLERRYSNGISFFGFVHDQQESH
jgi:outer membrane receptor protein involved in Fe transport